jgi:hypothetical protein
MSEDLEMGGMPPEEGGNRMFLIGAIILGGVFVVALISIFALYFLTQSGQPAAPQPDDLTATAVYQEGATQTADAQGTQTRVAVALQTAAITHTPSLTITPSLSPTVTSTPVVFATVELASPTPTSEETGVAGPQGGEGTATITTVRTGVPTALPGTGIGDSVGFPALLLLGGGSLLVIIVVRQLRLGRAHR